MKEPLTFQAQGKTRICNIWLYPASNLLLKDLQLEPFDIIICDGPYGILEPECEWDNFDLNAKEGREKYRQYYRHLFDACLKHLKPSGAIFIFNYSEGASIIKGVLDEEYLLHFRRWLSWVYWNHSDIDNGFNFRRSHESILYYTKEPGGFVFHKGNAPDVLSHPIIKIESSFFKDGAKPLKVIRYLLNATHRSGGRLLSLFAGSGTDMIVAAEYDMDAVGFEFDTPNFKMLVERIKNSGVFNSDDIKFQRRGEGT